jgi:hypothetical protein
MAPVRQKIHLSQCADSPGHLCGRWSNLLTTAWPTSQVAPISDSGPSPDAYVDAEPHAEVKAVGEVLQENFTGVGAH